MDTRIENIAKAEDILLQQPQNTANCNLLLTLYDEIANWKEVSGLYKNKSKHELVGNAFFNAAYQAKKLKNYHTAISLYNLALSYNVTGSEEVHVNLAVIYSENLRQENRAEIELKRALNVSPNFTPALYNLAGLYEELGNKEDAMKHYQALLNIMPYEANVLSRISLCYQGQQSKVLVEPITKALEINGLNTLDKINLYYALGKVYDDIKNYQKAFMAYKKANLLEKTSRNNFDTVKLQDYFKENKKVFNKQWYEENTSESIDRPVFICGMYRSGSTLLEQILSSHSMICAGGEVNYFENLNLSPSRIKNLNKAELTEMANAYIKHISDLFPDNNIITNKRPNNFLYIGLIKTLFPNAQIIHTFREIEDNCLSIYFQSVDEPLNYTNDLKDIFQLYEQHIEMIEHWQTLFPDSFHIVRYEELVQDVKGTTKKIFNALSVDWEDKCANFEKNKNSVKTASIWQVREKLHQKSKGRWKNYKDQIKKALQG